MSRSPHRQKSRKAPAFTLGRNRSHNCTCDEKPNWLGYAGTIYRAQGKTLDEAYVLHTRHWRDAASYVALTRSRGVTRVFVSKDQARDLEDLARQMSRQSHRGSTLGFSDIPAATDGPNCNQTAPSKDRFASKAAMKLTSSRSLGILLQRPARSIWPFWADPCRSEPGRFCQGRHRQQSVSGTPTATQRCGCAGGSKKSIKRMVEQIHALTDRTGKWQANECSRKARPGSSADHFPRCNTIRPHLA
jgi:hypothetical protein